MGFAYIFPEVEHTVLDLPAEILDLELGPFFDAIRADRPALVRQRHGLALADGELEPLAVGHELQREHISTFLGPHPHIGQSCAERDATGSPAVSRG
jgi:hypothetical protein